MKFKKTITAAVMAAVVGCGGFYASAASAGDLSVDLIGISAGKVACKDSQGNIKGVVTYSAKEGIRSFDVTMTGDPSLSHSIKWKLTATTNSDGGRMVITTKTYSFGPYNKRTTVTQTVAKAADRFSLPGVKYEVHSCVAQRIMPIVIIR